MKKVVFIGFFGFILIVFGSVLWYYTVPDSIISPYVEEVQKKMGFTYPEIIGFQPYWLVREGKPSYARDITTLAYFSLRVEQDGTIRKFDNPGEAEPGWRMVNSDTYAATLSAHRKAGTKLSLLVQNMVEEEILTLIEKPEEHGTKLVEEVAPIMQKHGFTDLNLDIESFTKASESARLGYVQFVQTVKDELTRQNLGTLTVELTPRSPIEMHLIDVAKIAEIADYVVLMAYDYHYIYSSVAGGVAPVGGVPTTAEYDVETALRETLRYAPASKVILGVPLYGYEWETLRDIPGSPVIPGSWQVATGKRIEEYIKTCMDCTRGFDAVTQEPYVIYKGETEGHFQQAFYENKQALEVKISLAKKYELAGVAMWALGYEPEGMLAPMMAYKKSAHFRDFGKKPSVPYTHIQPASLVLNPPTHALVGSIATMSGVVQKLGRQDEVFQTLNVPSSLVQGETVATGEDGTMEIQFPDSITMYLREMSEISFPELVPPNLFARQKNGVIRYQLLNTDNPWSIRVLRSLVLLDSGEIVVEIDGSHAWIQQISGSSHIGNISSDNVTTTYILEKGQTARIDESQQMVRIQ